MKGCWAKRDRERGRERERRAATMKEVIYVVHTGLYCDPQGVDAPSVSEGLRGGIVL